MGLKRVVWVGIAALVLAQMYFVRELVAALILLGVVFTAFAALVIFLQGARWIYDRAIVGAEAIVRSDFSRKPFRRLRSLIAQ